jgi:hypothetical protein
MAYGCSPEDLNGLNYYWANADYPAMKAKNLL